MNTNEKRGIHILNNVEICTDMIIMYQILAFHKELSYNHIKETSRFVLFFLLLCSYAEAIFGIFLPNMRFSKGFSDPSKLNIY